MNKLFNAPLRVRLFIVGGMLLAFSPAAQALSKFDNLRFYASSCAEGSLDGVGFSGLYLLFKSLYYSSLTAEQRPAEMLITGASYVFAYVIARWVAQNVIKLANTGYDYEKAKVDKTDDPARNLCWFLGVLSGIKFNTDFQLGKIKF